MKRHRISELSLFSGCALACALIAPVPAAPSETRVQEPVEASAALPSASDLIAAHARKVNGDKLEKTRSLHIKGKAKIEGMGIEGTYDRYAARPNRLAFALDLTGVGTVRYGFHDGVGWVVHPMMGAYVQEGSELLQAQLEADYDSATKNRERYESIETVARKSFDDKECWVVELHAKPLEGMDPEESKPFRKTLQYYEIESGLLIGQESTISAPTGSAKSTVVYHDYADFGGVLYPKRTVQSTDGMELLITVDSVEWDVVDETRFAFPKPIQTLVDAKK